MGVATINGASGDVQAVGTFNGSTGDVQGVGTFNGSTGSIQAVGTFNGSTGDVQGVGTFNGSTGDVQGVGTFNGLTGTIDTSTLLIHANGISADGATFGGNVIVGGGATLSGQLNAQAGVSASSLSINNAYSLPSADGSAGQVMMTDGSDAVSFQTIKFMANFVLDSDVPLVTGARDKAIYYIPYDNCVITEVHLRSDDASASGDATSLAVAIETIQRLSAAGGLNDANPTGVTLLTVTMDETASEDHVSSEVGLTHAVGTDNNRRAIRINVTDNSGNHTNLQVMIKMEARTT